MIPVSSKLGLGQVVFSPLAQGVLTGKYKPGEKPPADSRAADPRANVFMLNREVMSDENLVKVQNLSLIAKELNISMAQLALAWCLRLSDISAVIIGATKESQINDNVRASGVSLAEDIVQRIDQILNQ